MHAKTIQASHRNCSRIGGGLSNWGIVSSPKLRTLSGSGLGAHAWEDSTVGWSATALSGALRLGAIRDGALRGAAGEDHAADQVDLPGQLAVLARRFGLLPPLLSGSDGPGSRQAGRSAAALQRDAQRACARAPNSHKNTALLLVYIIPFVSSSYSLFSSFSIFLIFLSCTMPTLQRTTIVSVLLLRECE